MSIRFLSTSHRRQDGVAIITAVLVIALGTITMVAISASQQLDMQRERNEGIIQQARAFGISGERFAAVLLYRDKQKEERDGSDSLEDDWAQTIPPVPIDNASMQGCIVDMQGRFNLNNLVNNTGVADPVYKEQFRNLLAELNIEITKADAVIDWIDADVNFTNPDGAEDDYYTGLEVGYRTANSPFVSVSELHLVKGFSSAVEEEAEDYELLLPHISALPVSETPTAINVNTATPEVLASLSATVQPNAATLSRWETAAYEDYPECEDIFDLEPDVSTPSATGTPRNVEPWPTVAEFEAEARPAGAAAAAAPTTSTTPATPGTAATAAAPSAKVTDVLLDVKSNYYQVRIDVEAEGIRLSQYTLLERDTEGKTKVVYRSRDTL